MHWAPLGCHSDLFWAATSASSQVIPIVNKSLLTVLLQFVRGWPGPLLNPGTSQCNACQGMRPWSIRIICPIRQGEKKLNQRCGESLGGESYGEAMYWISFLYLQCFDTVGFCNRRGIQTLKNCLRPPEPDQNMLYLFPYQQPVLNFAKFLVNIEILWLDSKFRILQKTVVPSYIECFMLCETSVTVCSLYFSESDRARRFTGTWQELIGNPRHSIVHKCR